MEKLTQLIEIKVWKFSLYNDNGKVDCSQIAKQYGGGGHAGAAGFILNQEQFNKLINRKLDRCRSAKNLGKFQLYPLVPEQCFRELKEE
jgi:oligoribonuclease NrnB/cAMP/cGMP phosphodiesterase (DHH superfamily)